MAVVSSEPALPDLDEGEAASIRLALVSGPQTLLLIDERAGRAVAEAFCIRVAGTAAVTSMTLQRRLIESAPAVIQAVLERCGE